MVKVAILGYGVVGSGVAEILKNNAENIKTKVGEEIVCAKILDVRDFPGDPNEAIITKNAEEVFENDEIDIVVETIGGAKIAYEFTKRALGNSKHVVTSNKELVATHGPELLKLAKEHNVSYLYEASVGGGIPIIRPLQNCLAPNNISGILAILNGTTNYILTKMKNEGKDFDVALKDAQANGYAEQDPTADIEGIDACRKIAILSSIVYGRYVDSTTIPTMGITKISTRDMKYAEKLGFVIKLVGLSNIKPEGILARVTPLMIPKQHPLANVEDVFNGIVVRGDSLGDAMFYGRGAGSLPTASAVVADVMDIARHKGFIGMAWDDTQDTAAVDVGNYNSAWFVRIKVDAAGTIAKVKAAVADKLGNVNFVELDDVNDEVAFITELNVEKRIMQGIDDVINTCDDAAEMSSLIKFYK